MASRADTANLRAIAHVLATAPGLGAFTAAVGDLGLNDAVRLCETRQVPESLQRTWDELGYSLAQLPDAESIRLVLLGAEIQRRKVVARKTRKAAAPSTSVTADLCDASDAKLALRLLLSYGAQVELAPELGAI